MGQYFYVVNIDKQEYLHPHDFKCQLENGQTSCEGLKMGEFPGTLDLLAHLTCDSYAYAKHPLVGSWVGDRVQIAGDYSNKKFTLQSEDGESETFDCLYFAAAERFKRVSQRSDVQELFKLISES